MVSVCLPSDALLQHLQSYLGFSYLGGGVAPLGRDSAPIAAAAALSGPQEGLEKLSHVEGQEGRR